MNYKNVRCESNYYLSGNNLVSIVIGIKLKDRIILVSDSQASDKEAGTKQLNEIKIFNAKGENVNFIYSGAENPLLNKMIFDEIVDRYSSKIDFKIQCEEAYNKIRGQYPQRVVDYNLPIRLLIGVSGNNNFELYHLQPDGFVFSIPIEQIESIGCRNDWAKLIYKDILKSEKPINNYKDINYILAIALYTVDKIKKYDLYCGGKSQYKILYSDGKIENTNEQFVNDVEHNIPKINKIFKSKWWYKFEKQQ